ncbi:EF-hand domain-containing protein [Streptomyces sp. NPDC092307]|uniref:EF-hand domain-containing protein n=1 Tax=Streptomyces sp. NPDC092307 TaxID=3366013 RepID=UPI003823EF1E
MLTPERIRQLKSAFSASDSNRDGRLNAAELLSLIRSNCPAPPVTVNAFEFISMNVPGPDKAAIARQYSRFGRADSNGDGFVTLGELAALFGVEEDDRELAELFNQVDSNGDGKINFFEFMEISITRSGSTSGPYVVEECGAENFTACAEGGSPGIVPACAPNGALTLFRDWCFNQINPGQGGGDRPAIVIPSGESIESVAEYFVPLVDNPGPIHESALSWANKTEQECVLFGEWDNLEPGSTTLQDVWVLAPGQSMVEGTNPDRTNAFRVKSATAFNHYVPKPVILSPVADSTVAPWAPISGTASNAETVEIYESEFLLGTALVAGGLWSFTLPDGDEWSLGENRVSAVAVRGEEKSDPAIVDFSAEVRNLHVESELAGSWQGDESGYIYSYRIKLTAGETNVEGWEVGFGMLPPGSHLNPEFDLWFDVIQDGSPGDDVVEIILGSPDSGGVVLAGEDLCILVQVKIPPNVYQSQYSQLYGLYAKPKAAR